MAAILPASQIQLVGPLHGARTRTSHTEEPGWENVLQQLQEIRALTDDWDGQGAEAPTVANVNWAIAWVEQMRQYPGAIVPMRAVPGVGGELYLEWRCDDLRVDAEIAAPARVEWTLSESGKANRHWVTEGGLPYFLCAN
ncbi:MAG: hypothetical protein FJ271_32110 [Planctomycetes bacterium]|nr:hypothetical protein [Planctomycetota bacterium]